eukprot:COSAG01_NODE_8491_length_2766_cov_7.029246_4_plen_55_part_00
MHVSMFMDAGADVVPFYSCTSMFSFTKTKSITTSCNICIKYVLRCLFNIVIVKL